MHEHRMIRWIVLGAVVLTLRWNGESSGIFVNGILPTASIDIMSGNKSTKRSFHASTAFFGSQLEMEGGDQNPTMLRLVVAPQDDPLLCNAAGKKADSSSTTEKPFADSIVMVPRGECSFEWKTLTAQRLGAKAVFIYGTLASRYTLNKTLPYSDALHIVQALQENHEAKNANYNLSLVVNWPHDKLDYDCHHSRSFIPSNRLSFNPPPYNADLNDPNLKGSHSLCAQTSTNPNTFAKTCASKMCLLTGNIRDANNDDDDAPHQMEACCAWDNFIWLYNDPSLRNITKELVQIPALYLTVSQADDIFASFPLSSDSIVYASMYARYRPPVNLSAILIWILGVFVAWLAARTSAMEYRDEKEIRIEANDRIVEESAAIAANAASSSSKTGDDRLGQVRNRSTGRLTATTENTTTNNHHSNALPTTSNNNNNRNPEVLELTAWHALGFIFMASTSLMVLFVFKVYNLVKVMYAFGCSGALAQCIFSPLFDYLSNFFFFLGIPVITIRSQDIGTITVADILSFLCAYGMGFTWLALAFTQLHPETIPFFWITQDLMGACMCIMFLSVIKLNNIRVAAILLTVAFFYDIFFVFITPLLTKGGKSIMITVATSGGPPKADPSWCEKYPHDADCKGGDPLPMLLAVPRIGDFEGGASLLGLGDIVLPGLLLSFAARFDEAKRLVSVVRASGATTTTRAVQRALESMDAVGTAAMTQFRGGGTTNLHCHEYFPAVVVAYAIGLFMANAAVYIMQYGQPALLYLVPCCLGTVCFIGWRCGEMDELWNGPKAIQFADRLIMGDDDDDNNGNDEEQHTDNESNGEKNNDDNDDDGEKVKNMNDSLDSKSSSTAEEDSREFSGDMPLLSLT